MAVAMGAEFVIACRHFSGGTSMRTVRWALAAVAVAAMAGAALARQASEGAKGDWKAAAKAASDKGVAFLVSRQKDGCFEMQGKPEPGITALALAALLRSPSLPADKRAAATDKGLAFVMSNVQPDGSIYSGGLANYVTSASILALVASGDAKYKPVVDRAKRFLLTLQLDEGEKLTPKDTAYGGTGYDADEGGRPDLSNMSLWMDGVHAAGVPPGDAAYQKAIAFLSRCQNRSESNTTSVAAEVDGKKVETIAGNDGGGYYAPGESKAGYVDAPGGKRMPRSYGSMTYALVKCYMLAGLPKTDPRVQSAIGWIQKNWTLEENPGFDKSKDPSLSYQGLYYYYETLAEALNAYGEDVLTDGKGAPHRWREELAAKLISLQKPDGSWVNAKDRWWESSPDLVTAYALLAMSRCLEGK
jgi:prenyltransferase/squalene oxidase-like repeat protein